MTAGASVVVVDGTVLVEVVLVRRGAVVLGAGISPDWLVVLGTVDDDDPICCSHAASSAALPRRMKRRRDIQVGFGRLTEGRVYR